MEVFIYCRVGSLKQLQTNQKEIKCWNLNYLISKINEHLEEEKNKEREIYEKFIK